MTISLIKMSWTDVDYVRRISANPQFPEISHTYFVGEEHSTTVHLPLHQLTRRLGMRPKRHASAIAELVNSPGGGSARA